jgi:hypothetical protein
MSMLQFDEDAARNIQRRHSTSDVVRQRAEVLALFAARGRESASRHRFRARLPRGVVGRCRRGRRHARRRRSARALSDALLDSFCLIGPLSRCRERLAEYREAGVDLPILNPPAGPDAALATIRAFEGDAAPATQPEAASPAAAPAAPPPVSSLRVPSHDRGSQGTER